MKLHLESSGTQNAITGYGAGYVMVNREKIAKNIVVLPGRILGDWAAPSFAGLAPEHLAALAGLDLEIVLLGTGEKLRFPRPEIIAPLLRAGIGVEVMDLQAACRTYNILMAEGRKVAAALLLE